MALDGKALSASSFGWLALSESSSSDWKLKRRKQCVPEAIGPTDQLGQQIKDMRAFGMSRFGECGGLGLPAYEEIKQVFALGVTLSAFQWSSQSNSIGEIQIQGLNR
jgi:hypothetical protein